MLSKYIAGILVFICFSCSDVKQKLAKDNLPLASVRNECTTMPFHYLIVRDWLKSPAVRELEVFMNAKEFSAQNIGSLFSHLSEKFPEPDRLTIHVRTDWSQLDLPSDCPGIGAEGGSELISENYDFHRAVYYRRGEDVYFYYTSELKTEKMEKVVLSGTHQPKQRWEVNNSL